MINTSYFSALLMLLCSFYSMAQNPATINLNTQQTISSPTYVRATQSIKLQTGFNYSATNGTNPLLNMSISSNPSYVGSFYQGSASQPLGPMNCSNPGDRTQKLVGEIEGEFSVSATGAAIYDLPIYVAPGTAGLEPSLSIAYSSQAGVGLLGKGFNLSGLSGITRTGKTFYHNGVSQGIGLNSSDVYEIDGTKMFSLSGVYGSANSTYYTEAESFATITAKGQQGNGPQWIEVRDKKGNILEFGNTVDSRLVGIGDNTVLSWRLSKITDEFGNYMTYTYKQLPGELIIDHIDYTGNIYSSLIPYNSIVFEYVDAGEKNTYYFGGKEFRSTKLLKSIKILAENQQVKKYVFDYIWEKVSCLARVVVEDADGNELYPTEFCWNDINANNPWSMRSNMSIFQNQSDYTGLKSAIPADLDGDGFSDFVCVYPGSSKYNIMLNKVVENLSFNTGKIDFESVYNGTSIAGYEYYLGSTVTDENKDNNQEVYTILGEGFDYTIQKITYDKLTSSTQFNVIGTYSLPAHSANLMGSNNPSYFTYDVNDYTGDGVVDILRIDPLHINLTSSQGNLSYLYNSIFTEDDKNKIARPIEIDGQDKIPEYIIFDFISETKIKYEIRKVSLGATPSLTQILDGWIDFPYNTEPNRRQIIQHVGLGDFNGDGKTDIAYLSELLTSLNVMYGTGVGFTSPKAISTFSAIPGSNNLGQINYVLSVTDLNGDGKSDIAITGDQTGTVTSYNYFSYISTGDEFSKGSSYIGNWTYFEKGHTRYLTDYVNRADFNGDGIYDMVSVNDPSTDYIATNHLNSRNMAIEHINTAMYRHHTIKYMNIGTEVLWKPGNQLERIFTKTSSTTFSTPLYNYKPSINCVYEVWNTEGESAEIKNTTKYRYYTAVFHKDGRGFLGFEGMATRDVLTGLGSYRTNKFNTTYYLPVSNEISTVSFSTITTSNITDNFYIAGTHSRVKNNYLFTPRNTKGYYLSLMSTVTTDYVNSTEITKSYIYNLNASGNVDQSTSSYGWNGGNITKTESIDNNYILNNGIYKLQSSSKIVTQQGDVGYYRTASYEYDPQGHLTKKVDDPGTTQSLTTIFSQFDNYGHPLTESISATDVLPRSTQNVYDSKGRFLIKSINSLNHVEEFVYEPKFGNIIQRIDISGLISTFQYDGLGRLIQSVLADGSVNTISYKWEHPQNYLYANNSGMIYPLGIYSITTKNEGAAYTKEYCNGGGKLIRKETQGLNGEIIVSDYKYSTDFNTTILPHGLLQEITEPYYLGSQTTFLVTRSDYDGLLREIGQSIFERNGSSYLNKNISTTISYSQPSTNNLYVKFCKQIVDQAGRKVIKEVNTAGQNDKVINTDSGNTQTALYTFSSCGKPKMITLTNNQNSQSIVTSMVYNDLGQQIQLNDPSTGVTTYEYSTIGQLLKQTDGAGFFTYSYDLAGRIERKTGSVSGITTYDYITSQNGLEQIKTITGPNSVMEYTYDNLGRQVEFKETVGSEILKTNLLLDKYGRTIQYTYPGGFITKNVYNNLGDLTKITTANNQVIWQIDEKDAIGEIKKYTYGNGISTQIARTTLHQLQSIIHGVTPIHKQEYVFDPQRGNLTSRKFSSFGDAIVLQEVFSYDHDRLSQSQQIDPISQTSIQVNNLNFDIIGNIKHKDDAGDYVYGSANSPYQLTALNNATNNVNINTLLSTYNDFKKVTQLTETSGNKQMNFLYGNNDERVRVDYSINGVNQYTRYYSGNYDKQITVSGTEQWNYIPSPSGLAAIYYVDEAGIGQMLYVLSDHLGSPILLTNSGQQIVEQNSFDSWGRRRNPTDWSYNNITPPQYLNRGFTFHEHIDELGLINMNGRIYDPVLGRFIQPDNYIQSPDALQNFNRYAYCLNNPLAYTDPSGNLFLLLLSTWIVSGSIAHLSGCTSSETFQIAGTATLSVAAISLFSPYLKLVSGIQIPLMFSDMGYELQKETNVLAVHVGFTMGTDVLGIGVDVSFGIPKSLGVSARAHGGIYYFDGNNDHVYGGWETRYGYEVSLFNFFTASTTYYNREGDKLDQQLALISIGNSCINFKYENDYMFGLPADGGDRYRTAALQLNVGDFKIGCNLFTGDPGLKDRISQNVKGQDTYVAHGSNNPDEYRSGSAYIGYGPFRLGTNAEINRHLVQNKMAHDTLYYWLTNEKLPHFAIDPNRSTTLYFQFGGSFGNSLW